jgi:ABC-type transport system involved in cytochrome bd biosynthesis fused ATPase/permease subunit
VLRRVDGVACQHLLAGRGVTALVAVVGVVVQASVLRDQVHELLQGACHRGHVHHAVLVVLVVLGVRALCG